MSFAFKLGRGIGRTAGYVSAQAVQRGQQTIEATGDLGRGVKSGYDDQYAMTTARIAKARAEAALRVAAEMEARVQPAPAAAPVPKAKAAKAAT